MPQTDMDIMLLFGLIEKINNKGIRKGALIFLDREGSERVIV